MIYSAACKMFGDIGEANDIEKDFISTLSALEKNLKNGPKLPSRFLSSVIDKCRDYLRSKKDTVPLDEISETLSSLKRVTSATDIKYYSISQEDIPHKVRLCIYKGLINSNSSIYAPVVVNSKVVSILSVEGLEVDERNSLIVQEYTKIIARTIKQSQTLKDAVRLYDVFRVVYEEIASLNSIDAEELAGSLIKSVHRIFPESAGGFVHACKTFSFGLNPDEKIVSLARKAAGPVVYNSIVIIPLKKEDWFVAIKGKPNDQQLWMLEIICNYAGEMFVNAQRYKDTKELATYDGLTGLYNRRSFMTNIRNEIKRHKRQNKPMSVLLMDMDHFKKINDTYGHPAGDIVLRTVADIIKHTARTTDICGRYGGEEFAVILTETHLKQALNVAEKIRRNVMNTEIPVDNDVRLKVTFSIGVSMYRMEEQASKLLSRTDQLLYRAKENGRNRVFGDSSADL